MKQFWRSIWNLAEFYSIDLGRFAPWILGKMLGVKGRRIL